MSWLSEFEPVKRGIEGPLGQVEGTFTAHPQILRDRVAMRRSGRQRGEDESVEMSLEGLRSHTSRSYT